jgi:hypothetical protein
LMLITRDDTTLLDAVDRGELSVIARAPEPADEPYFIVAERPSRQP